MAFPIRELFHRKRNGILGSSSFEPVCHAIVCPVALFLQANSGLFILPRRVALLAKIGPDSLSIVERISPVSVAPHSSIW
jgi:hypothetical protein